MRIMVTGFGSFPGVGVNPSAHLVECLPLDLPPLAGHEVRVDVLPVTWRACADWVERALAADVPDILLHVGVRASGRAFDLETVARNTCRTDLPDAVGEHWPAAVIHPGGPAELSATLPAAELCAKLGREQLPIEPSSDAGGYLCNFILYRSLLRLSGAGAWAGFLHIPPMAGLDPLHADGGYSLAIHVCLLNSLLEHLIDLRRQAREIGGNRPVAAAL